MYLMDMMEMILMVRLSRRSPRDSKVKYIVGIRESRATTGVQSLILMGTSCSIGGPDCGCLMEHVSVCSLEGGRRHRYVL